MTSIKMLGTSYQVPRTHSKTMRFMVGLTTVVVVAWTYLKLTVGGVCPQPMTDPNFDLDLYYGRWYEMARDPNFYEKGDCTTAQYYELPNNYVSVNNREFILEEEV